MLASAQRFKNLCREVSSLEVRWGRHISFIPKKPHEWAKGLLRFVITCAGFVPRFCKNQTLLAAVIFIAGAIYATNRQGYA